MVWGTEFFGLEFLWIGVFFWLDFSIIIIIIILFTIIIYYSKAVFF